MKLRRRSKLDLPLRSHVRNTFLLTTCSVRYLQSTSNLIPAKCPTLLQEVTRELAEISNGSPLTLPTLGPFTPQRYAIRANILWSSISASASRAASVLRLCSSASTDTLSSPDTRTRSYIASEFVHSFSPASNNSMFACSFRYCYTQ